MKISGDILCECGDILYKKYDQELGCWIYYCYSCQNEECIYNRELEEEY
jgi:hypothetical protein